MFLMTEIKTNPDMLMKKHCTEEVIKELKEVVTPHGWTVRKAIQSGVDNPDSSIGVYAGDPQSYTMLASLFDPVIRDYHNYDMKGHKSDFSLDGLSVENLDPEGEYVVSTRIRVGRNFAKYAFPSAISTEDRASMESEIVTVLNELSGDLKGQYFPLDGMAEDVVQKMIEDHFCLNKEIAFLKALV